MDNRYDDTVQNLFTMVSSRKIKLGLQRMHEVDAALGSPSLAFPAILIAGTNGKGSVASKLAHALQHSGYRTGLYTSPHLATFRERIRIDGTLINEEEVVAGLDIIQQAGRRVDAELTFFESTTLLAFQHFANHHVDIAVIEVGMGGRLCATNIVNPVLSIITGIGFDHCQYLGDTVEKIAIEKAGILRAGVPAVLGPTVPTNVDAIAGQLGVPTVRTDHIARFYDGDNSAIARQAMELLNQRYPLEVDACQQALTIRPPCRFEEVGNAILDVAHNPEGLRRLGEEVAARDGGQRSWIVGFSPGKDWKACLDTVAIYAEKIIVTQADGCVAAEELAQYLNSKGIECVMTSSVTQAIEASAPHQHVVVAGTFLIMAEARYALGIDEPRDRWVVQEAAAIRG